MEERSNLRDAHGVCLLLSSQMEPLKVNTQLAILPRLALGKGTMGMGCH